MNIKKIGVWGQFGDGGKIADGQAVRTTIITEEIKKRYGAENIAIVNTNNWRRHPVSFLFKTIKLNACCEKVVIFPADNGFKVVVPILDITNRIWKRELYNVVIGGYLPGLLAKRTSYIKMLQKYNALFVQTERIRQALQQFSLKNIHILSNLKRLKTLEKENIYTNHSLLVKLCVVSRITNDKGISCAIDAVKMANEILGENLIHLDFFGIIADEYANEFKRLLQENDSFVSYCGVLDFDKTTEVLKEYFLLLLPTFYYGEGFPGCVVDAYNAALPIVATDWNYNRDVIKDGYNGLIVPAKDPKRMSEAILRFYRNREFSFQIAINNLGDAEKYKPDHVLRDFYCFLDE